MPEREWILRVGGGRAETGIELLPPPRAARQEVACRRDCNDAAVSEPLRRIGARKPRAAIGLGGEHEGHGLAIVPARHHHGRKRPVGTREETRTRTEVFLEAPDSA